MMLFFISKTATTLFALQQRSP